MSVKINYSTKINKTLSNNSVMFVDEKFSLKNIQKFISKDEFSYINDLLKISDLKKNIIIFEISSKKKIILISIKKDFKSADIESLGAEFYGQVNYGKSIEKSIHSK